jgi:hypothetical protein
MHALLVAKLLYFLLFGGLSAYFPFVPVILKNELGFSELQIGSIRMVCGSIE